MNFVADKVKVNGPKVDGGFTVTFEVGEHQQFEVAKLLAIPQQTTMKVVLEIDE